MPIKQETSHYNISLNCSVDNSLGNIKELEARLVDPLISFWFTSVTKFKTALNDCILIRLAEAALSPWLLVERPNKSCQVSKQKIFLLITQKGSNGERKSRSSLCRNMSSGACLSRPTQCLIKMMGFEVYGDIWNVNRQMKTPEQQKKKPPLLFYWAP